MQKLHEKLKCYPKHLMDPYFQPNKSFKIEVETFCRHFTQRQKVDKIEVGIHSIIIMKVLRYVLDI